MQVNLPHSDIQPAQNEDTGTPRQRRYRSARGVHINSTTNEIGRESDDNRRYTIIKPNRGKPYALTPPVNGKFDIPELMLVDDGQDAFNLHPIIKQLILYTVMALGFIIVLNANNSMYYVLFSIITVFCVVWFIKLNKLMLLQFTTVFIGCILGPAEKSSFCYSHFITRPLVSFATTFRPIPPLKGCAQKGSKERAAGARRS